LKRFLITLWIQNYKHKLKLWSIHGPGTGDIIDAIQYQNHRRKREKYGHQSIYHEASD